MYSSDSIMAQQSSSSAHTRGLTLLNERIAEERESEGNQLLFLAKAMKRRCVPHARQKAC